VTHDDIQDECEPADDGAAPTLVNLVVVVGRRGEPESLRRRGRLITPGGLLILVVASSITVDVVAVVAEARSAGLRYLQHNVAFPVPLPAVAPAPRVDRACPVARVHARIHTDVLVFQRPPGDD